MRRFAALASIACAAVQGGIPGGAKDVLARHREITRAHVAATVAMSERMRSDSQEPVDLLVWPESSLIVDPQTDLVARRQVERASPRVTPPSRSA